MWLMINVSLPWIMSIALNKVVFVLWKPDAIALIHANAIILWESTAISSKKTTIIGHKTIRIPSFFCCTRDYFALFLIFVQRMPYMLWFGRGDTLGLLNFLMVSWPCTREMSSPYVGIGGLNIAVKNASEPRLNPLRRPKTLLRS